MKKIAFLLVIGLVSFGFSGVAHAKFFNSSSDEETTESSAPVMSDSLGSSSLSGDSEVVPDVPVVAPPVEEPTVSEPLPVVESKKSDRVKSDSEDKNDDSKLSDITVAKEIEIKLKDIKSQEENVNRMKTQLDRETDQLETMKSEFCLNFKNDCSKIGSSSGNFSSKSSGFFKKA